MDEEVKFLTSEFTSVLASGDQASIESFIKQQNSNFTAVLLYSSLDFTCQCLEDPQTPSSLTYELFAFFRFRASIRPELVTRRFIDALLEYGQASEAQKNRVLYCFYLITVRIALREGREILDATLVEQLTISVMRCLLSNKIMKIRRTFYELLQQMTKYVQPSDVFFRIVNCFLHSPQADIQDLLIDQSRPLQWYIIDYKPRRNRSVLKAFQDWDLRQGLECVDRKTYTLDELLGFRLMRSEEPVSSFFCRNYAFRAHDRPYVTLFLDYSFDNWMLMQTTKCARFYAIKGLSYARMFEKLNIVDDLDQLMDFIVQCHPQACLQLPKQVAKCVSDFYTYE
ncbi:hypothetical protein Ciccas_007181 [Cichlidogyrus casuarinus]|uniref:Uncharacterized protein n=1 Tax=Cichlidogyrus casuarinus TaxID=1844966 RepID=A0ABD2Q7K7_9PLAT